MENFTFENIKKFLDLNNCKIEECHSDIDQFIGQIGGCGGIEYHNPKLFTAIKKTIFEYYKDNNIVPSKYIIDVKNEKLLKEILNPNSILNFEAKKLHKQAKKDSRSSQNEEMDDLDRVHISPFNSFCENELCKFDIVVTKDGLRPGRGIWYNITEKWVDELSKKWIKYTSEKEQMAETK